MGEVVADLGSVPVPQVGLLGPVVLAPQVAPAHQAGAVSADELHGWHERGAPAAVHAQQICCRAQHHHRDGGRHSTAMPSAAPQQAAASGRPSLRSSNQAPRLRKKVLAGCCHSAWLLTGHAQLPRPNASAIRAVGTGWTKPRAARNTNSAASAVSREAVRAAPCHDQKRSCSISTNESSTACQCQLKIAHFQEGRWDGIMLSLPRRAAGGSPASGAPIPKVLTYTSGTRSGSHSREGRPHSQSAFPVGPRWSTRSTPRSRWVRAPGRVCQWSKGVRRPAAQRRVQRGRDPHTTNSPLSPRRCTVYWRGWVGWSEHGQRLFRPSAAGAHRGGSPACGCDPGRRKPRPRPDFVRRPYERHATRHAQSRGRTA